METERGASGKVESDELAQDRKARICAKGHAMDKAWEWGGVTYVCRRCEWADGAYL